MTSRGYIILFLLFLAVQSVGQLSPNFGGRVQDNSTAFGINLGVGATIYNVASQKYYLCLTAAISTETLTTASAKFRLIPKDSVYEYVTPFRITKLCSVDSVPIWIRGGVITEKDTTKAFIEKAGGFRYPGNGDVNGSSTLNGIDALYSNFYVKGLIKLTDLQKSKADFDGDGKITLGDGFWIQDAVTHGGLNSAYHDTIRHTIGTTLYSYTHEKVNLAGKYGSGTSGLTPQGFDVEANGSLRIPLSEKLYFGGITSSTASDSVCSLGKIANGVTGLVGKLNISSIPNSISDTIFVDSSGHLKKSMNLFHRVKYSGKPFGIYNMIYSGDTMQMSMRQMVLGGNWFVPTASTANNWGKKNYLRSGSANMNQAYFYHAAHVVNTFDDKDTLDCAFLVGSSAVNIVTPFPFGSSGAFMQSLPFTNGGFNYYLQKQNYTYGMDSAVRTNYLLDHSGFYPYSYNMGRELFPTLGSTTYPWGTLYTTDGTSGNWKIAYTHSQSPHQTIINGNGLVRASGTSLSFDNSTYVTGTPWATLYPKRADSNAWTPYGYVTPKALFDGLTEATGGLTNYSTPYEWSETQTYDKNLKFSNPPYNSSATSGTIIPITANSASLFGDVVFINASGKAQFCKADAIANCPYSLAMCSDASIAANASGNWLTHGTARYDSWSWTVGGLIYVSTMGTTGNTLTQTAPSSANNVVMPVGVALSNHTIYFYGNMNSVEHL